MPSEETSRISSNPVTKRLPIVILVIRQVHRTTRIVRTLGDESLEFSERETVFLVTFDCVISIADDGNEK
jgi:hypothetical protein